MLVKRAIIVTLSCINHAETSFRVWKGWVLVADEITARSKNVEICFDSFVTNSIRALFKQLLTCRRVQKKFVFTNFYEADFPDFVKFVFFFATNVFFSSWAKFFFGENRFFSARKHIICRFFFAKAP